MNNFEKALVTYIGQENLEKIQSVRIGIGGAGGLGSNCAFNLIRSGFKHFTIADFDVVEYTNLNRQFFFYHQVGKPKVHVLKENLLAINPDAKIEAVQVKLEEENLSGIFEDCDIIVEAFDKAVYKKMIVESYLKSEKLLVSASGLAGWGNSDAIKVHKVKERFYIVGDLVSEVGDSLPPISPRVNITAAKQADVILEYVLGKG
ncbi:sulfur carrier protein ThiS adenylyltransferase ThiF [Petroclostridium sp. X23]|uniref:sulfur carrier protein ThiS adenylyltransferase ThiF n=1 Tax=Petroclostridium sp. X23 TaxID=3045146 RepID=UPI0024AE3B22|nr:sulfur carrier protein ThiS adenylyltransferase ThiF [Petroclostridium sp. X23]WHH60693.1 sulfur carrier protein ThiS adenylyltransferase ThiF [Petroclostridium sp. X23]